MPRNGGLLTFVNTPPRPCLEVDTRSTRCLRAASAEELSQFAMARVYKDTTRKLGHNCHWKIPVEMRPVASAFYLGIAIPVIGLRQLSAGTDSN